jgi:hypothetical protein
MSLTGQWKLNPKKCTSQKELLQLMGRKFWEISAIDKANEDFRLIHFKKPVGEGREIHFFDKLVVIYLESTVLKLLSAILPIEFDRVRYTHKLVANNKNKPHADDEKRFGECSSKTTWDPESKENDGVEGFTIRWYVKTGILKVFHFVNSDGDLQVNMEMTNAKGKVSHAKKVYERQPMGDDMKAYIAKSQHKQYMV